MSSALRQKIVSDVRNYSSVSTRAALDSKGRRNVSVDAALWRALDQFDQVSLRAAVDSGADLEVRDQNGLTPLEIVIKWNHKELMGLICSHLSEDSL
jgi:ankyrin repeat protein